MPRTMTAIALVLAAFGMGYGARTAIDLRQGIPAVVPDSQPSPDPDANAAMAPALAQTGDGIDVRPDPLLPVATLAAAPEHRERPILLPPASIPVKPARMTVAAVSASTPTQAAPVTASVALAYAPAVPPVPDPFAVLKSLDGASVHEIVPAPDLAPFSPADQLATREAISAYQKGDVAAGDASAKRISDLAARALAEWVIVRSGNRAIGHQRIRAFIQANPQWPTQALLARRAEEAFIADVKTPRLILAFFAARQPVTAMGKIALARSLVSDGKKSEGDALFRSVWRDDHFSDEAEDAVLKEFSGVLTRDDHRARMERYNFKSMWTKALRAAARIGPDHVALVKARQAVDNEAANAKALVAALPASLANDSSTVFAPRAIGAAWQ